MKRLVGSLAVGFAVAGLAGAVDLVAGFDLADASPVPYPRVFGHPGGENPAGDSFSAAPLAQDGASAFFLSDAAPGTHTFDGSAEGAGNNLAGSTGGTYSVNEAYTPIGANVFLVQVEMTALNATGAPEPWIAAGVTGPAGPFTSWRLDLGSNAGGTDKITPNLPWTLLSSGFSVFDSAGGGLGSFAMTLDSSNAAGLSGVSVVGLGGANVAGFDLATIQMFWEIEVIPEPASLLLVGLGAIVALRRR